MAQAFSEQLDSDLGKMFDAFDIPAAIAVVVKGGDVYIKTHGEKRIGEGEPIGPDTAFIIASCSKAFCGALAASLVDDGVVDWNERVIETVGEFVLSDPWVTKNLTLRDLLGMRTGLKREGICEFGFNADRECAAYFNYMRNVGWDAGFRETFTYSNAGYAAAATLLERKGGEKYSDLVRKRIFEPAGMRHAVSRSGVLEGHPDHFYPHVRLHDKTVALPELVSVGWEGSTAVYLSANDVAQWLRLQLGEGEVNGRRVLSKESIGETRRPNSIDTPGKLTGEHLSLYSMGWQPFDYHGRLIFRHTGSELGSSTFTMFCPEERLGVACYVGLYSSAAVAGGYMALNSFMGLPTEGLAETYKKALDERVNGAVSDIRTRFPDDPKKARKNSLKGAKGRYASPIYGDASIIKDDERLRIEFAERPMLSAELFPVGDDIYDIKHDNVGMEQELFGDYMRLRLHRSLGRVESFEHSLFGAFKRKRGK